MYLLIILFYTQIIYNDLSNDKDLFGAYGDYQFIIYRLMRKALGDDWTNFKPKTNVLWLHYVVDKLVCGVRYLSTKTRCHNHAIDQMMVMRDKFLDYNSAHELAQEMFIK